MLATDLPFEKNGYPGYLPRVSSIKDIGTVCHGWRQTTIARAIFAETADLCYRISDIFSNKEAVLDFFDGSGTAFIPSAGFVR